jgi:HEPN domain-containing protein
MPVRFLYYHAIELFLKSYLVLHGYTEAKVKGIGHRVKDLAVEAAKKGLAFDDEDTEVIGLMAEESTVIESRYLRVGLFRWPAVDALDRTAASLLDSIRRGLRAAGRKVR